MPLLFDQVIAQHMLKKQLREMVQQNRVGHATLFAGPKGAGGLPLAMAFARYLLCQQRSENDSCGQCPSCLKCENLGHPDLHFVYPVNTTKEVKKNPISQHFTNEWRKAVIENPYITLEEWLQLLEIENKQGTISVHESDSILQKVGLKPFEADCKVVIIWLPEKMNVATANKLLKVLEEPPEKTVFLLVSDNPEQILPTVLSRTQILKLETPLANEIAEGLSNTLQINSDRARQIADIADGNISIARKLAMNEGEANDNYSTFVQWMRFCFEPNQKMPEIIDWVEKISKIGRERQKQFLTYGLKMFQSSLRMNYNLDKLQSVPESQREFLTDFAPFVNESNCLRLIAEFNKAITDVERNANPKILFLDLSLQLAFLLKVKRVQQAQNA